MKQLWVMTIVLVSSFAVFGKVHAKASCTSEPKEKWLTLEAFRQMAEQEGYKIRKLKETGTCFEIYGHDKNGKKVEVYFDPTNGKIVRSK